ncbi:MAG: flippase-like domain-containing protein [Chlorobiaceae bacterium]|nr:flippase-like domain-containing protein [Chlorobiaceae bacterium]NTV60452.1 flippase-like domain-containing protein [Chlorobiaceae bacterium]
MAKSNSVSKKRFKLVKSILQLLVSILGLSLVLMKTDINGLGTIIRNANPWYLLLAFVFFNISKIFNAIRLNRLLKLIGIRLSFVYNIKLYYLGMFYNLFLPGGIGGDGYKIYVLQKNHGLKTINVFHAVFWDRVCGIAALVFLSTILLLPSSFALKFPGLVPYAWLQIILVYPLVLLVNRFIYPQFLGVFAIVTLESFLIQATQVISAYFILIALTNNGHLFDYLAIFLMSTVATIVPITIGGAGTREMTFYYLLDSIHLETDAGVALSLIFFAISAVSSLAGILSRIRHEKSESVMESEQP